MEKSASKQTSPASGGSTKERGSEGRSGDPGMPDSSSPEARTRSKRPSGATVTSLLSRCTDHSRLPGLAAPARISTAATEVGTGFMIHSPGHILPRQGLKVS
ncbi:MAG: hypothetical protein AO394_02940 [Candidatus Fermentibacter daniensis]|nr:MAG: hypothetical protein AO394_02940 [Candidatus Fermentibacter daniensis]